MKWKSRKSMQDTYICEICMPLKIPGVEYHELLLHGGIHMFLSMLSCACIFYLLLLQVSETPSKRQEWWCCLAGRIPHYSWEICVWRSLYSAEVCDAMLPSCLPDKPVLYNTLSRKPAKTGRVVTNPSTYAKHPQPLVGQRSHRQKPYSKRHHIFTIVGQGVKVCSCVLSIYLNASVCI